MSDIPPIDLYYGESLSQLQATNELDMFEKNAHALRLPSLWFGSFIAQTQSIRRCAELREIMARLQYRLCDNLTTGYETVILQYQWKTLGCDMPEAYGQLSDRTNQL